MTARTAQISAVECLRQIKRFVDRHQLLSHSDRVLVAVSGGPDSVALLRLFVDLRDEFQLHLEVAHLEHGIRGAEARADAAFVAELAAKFDLPFHLKEVSLPAIRLAAGKGNLEALAREARYRFFAEVAAVRGLDKVATAHTRDDQAETVVMRFLRGSGVKGLGGMAPLQSLDSIGGAPVRLAVIRPLLEISKAEIVNYLNLKNQLFRLDRTNRDAALLRNWVRLELLPKIHERFDGQLETRLTQQAEIMRGENELLDESARRILQGISTTDKLSRSGLLAAPVALRCRLLRLWIEAVRGNLRGLDFVHIDDLLRLIEQGAPHGRMALPGGWELARQYDQLELVRRSQRTKRVCYAYDFTCGSTLSIPEAGCELRSELTQAPIEGYCADAKEAIFDLGGLTGPLTVRNFRNGDSIQPFGMTGHKKLKDLFIERKLALTWRAALPLLVLGGEVLWVPGCCRSERAKVTAESQRMMRVKLVEWKT